MITALTMTAYQRDVQLPRGTPPRLYHKKRDMESSMLQYSERMRVISAARVSLGDGLEALERMDSRDSERELGWSNSEERRTIQRAGQKHNTTRERRDDSLPQIGPTTYKPRRQRPMSFDEKELRHNMSVVHTRRRPYSFDERELKRNEAANAQFRSKQHREAFLEHEHPIVIPTSDVEEEVHKTPEAGEVKISFVSASDLYELVDINRQVKGNQSSSSRGSAIKLVNVPDAVKFVQNFEARSDGSGLRGESFSLQRKPDSRGCKSKSEKKKFAKTKLEFKTDQSGKTESSAIRKSSSVQPQVESVTPLSIFLEQAASEFASQNALSIRPKRAKRMSLRKPRLLDIPEAEDSTLPHVGPPKLETRFVHPPTRISLQTIKEVKEDKRERAHPLEIRDTLLKSPQGNTVKTEYSNKTSPRKHRHKHANKTSQPDLDIDRLLMTSIYPTVPWDLEYSSNQQSYRHFVVPEKNSHKEKAHRKMKKLIFLRDRPDQHYRRDT